MSKVQQYVKLQLECKYNLELTKTVLTLYCNEFINSIVNYTTNPTIIQKNQLYYTLWINANHKRKPNICI